MFYSHVNYSVTKMYQEMNLYQDTFYSHVNYSVTKIVSGLVANSLGFTVT